LEPKRSFNVSIPNPLYLVWWLWTYRQRKDRERRLDLFYGLMLSDELGMPRAKFVPCGPGENPYNGPKEILDYQPDRVVVLG
jgi:hypothetical protein